jgi:hypothetical protein
MELKLSIEALKKLQQINNDDSMLSTGTIPIEPNSNYLIIDCFHNNDRLVK